MVECLMKALKVISLKCYHRLGKTDKEGPDAFFEAEVPWKDSPPNFGGESSKMTSFLVLLGVRSLNSGVEIFPPLIWGVWVSGSSIRGERTWASNVEVFKQGKNAPNSEERVIYTNASLPLYGPSPCFLIVFPFFSRDFIGHPQT